MDGGGADSDDNGDIFTEKKAKVVVSTSTRNKSHLPPVRNQIGGDKGSAGSSMAPVASTQDSDDDDEDDETSINKSAKDKNIATVMITLKNGINSTLRVNSVNWTRLIKRRRKIKQLERKNKEKEKLRFERMEVI